MSAIDTSFEFGKSTPVTQARDGSQTILPPVLESGDDRVQVSATQVDGISLMTIFSEQSA